MFIVIQHNDKYKTRKDGAGVREEGRGMEHSYALSVLVLTLPTYLCDRYSKSIPLVYTAKILQNQKLNFDSVLLKYLNIWVRQFRCKQ